MLSFQIISNVKKAKMLRHLLFFASFLCSTFAGVHYPISTFPEADMGLRLTIDLAPNMSSSYQIEQCFPFSPNTPFQGIHDALK